uniref:C-type lectin domain-containing protein n=1 Tax=Oryzias latipes TaxID=8090 RepID=A0A3P9IG62_ORYLA
MSLYNGALFVYNRRHNIFVYGGIVLCPDQSLSDTSSGQRTSLCSPIGLTVTFAYINNPMKWFDALSFCREHHTDLASVRNMEENQKIMELTPAGKKPWIGLFRDTWKWTDGSNSSFRNWKVGEPNNAQNLNENCAAADFESSGQWDDRNCDEKRAFVCYAGDKKLKSIC